MHEYYLVALRLPRPSCIIRDPGQFRELNTTASAVPEPVPNVCYVITVGDGERGMEGGNHRLYNQAEELRYRVFL